MTVTVYDTIKNSRLRDFPIICGVNGLDNEVIKTGIIDYEFSLEGFFENHQPFGYGDFLIASLMFTGGDESALFQMVEKLIELKVSGLAVKNIFFKEIPKSVVNLCNENAFPIVLFDNTIYFEEIIKEIESTIQMSDWINLVEAKIDTLYLKELSRHEVGSLSKEIRVAQLENALAFYMAPKTAPRHSDMQRIINSYRNHPYRNEKISFFKYQQGFLIIIASDHPIRAKFEEMFLDMLHILGLKLSDYSIGVSSIYHPVKDLDFCIKEAVWSQKIASILSVERKDFSALGTWRILLQSQQASYLNHYMENYLNPIINDTSDASKELIKTAVAYIKSEGNTKITADSLFIHENTVRYRMNKIREKLDPSANDFIFYENLSLAVKIYLLNNPMER